MDKNKLLRNKNTILIAIFIAIWMVWWPRVFHRSTSAATTPHKVHVAFGFHVNLYHSFRGDTNDENGFGQDIRVIRHTIRELDRFNRRGIPVKAVWDFDNLFSLQDILPENAPDIITDVQRRVRGNKDDVILMSYNNGMASAMNHPEFISTIERAISNEEGSGIRDLFGRVAPVVRPQEMMTTPGHFERYKEFGIEYAALYYSATPFDAFRLFSRELTPTEAYNPVTYKNPDSGEQIVVIPTYHAGDLVENVSLRNWVEKLHIRQTEGEIDRDVLIFINFDADAEFWTGADLPWYLDWLPNTGGIGQLIDSIADLDYVSFSNLTDYLATHPPVGSIHFNQDTADGSFHGYHSWAEKAYASDYWTRIVRNRRAFQAVKSFFSDTGETAMPESLEQLMQRCFETRLRALSTTNFGLAGPFLARQRETAMADLLDVLDGYTDQLHHHLSSHLRSKMESATPPNTPSIKGRMVDSFFLLNVIHYKGQTGDRWLTFTLPDQKSKGSAYFLVNTGGETIPAFLEKTVPHEDALSVSVTLRVSKRHLMPDGLYFLFHQDDSPHTSPNGQPFADERTLKNEFIHVVLNDRGHIDRVMKDGRLKLGAGSLVPYIQYKGERSLPDKLTVSVVEHGENGVASIRIHGPWNGPKKTTRAPGWVDYNLRVMQGVPYLFIDGEVKYPDTYRQDLLYPEKPMLARKIDAGWEAAAPLELRFSIPANREKPFFIHKRNYLGKESAYPVDYYRHSPENLNVDGINNHITAAYVGVTTAGQGMAVAMNTGVNANFAFCPFKMEYLPKTESFAISANPFGTYHGDQLVPPTRGNRQGYEVVRLTAPQLKSAGPTYNGYHDRFDVMVSFFEGDTIPEWVKEDLMAFANRPLTIWASAVKESKKEIHNPLPPAGFMAMPYKNGILFHWEDPVEEEARYSIRFGPLSGPGESLIVASGSTHFVEMPHGLISGEPFSATVQTIFPDGKCSDPSPEVRFRLRKQSEPSIDLPNTFKAKVFLANVSAWAERYLF